MKFNAAAAAVSAAMLSGMVRAEEAEEAPVVPELPTFTVSLKFHRGSCALSWDLRPQRLAHLRRRSLPAVAIYTSPSKFNCTC
jgi:hypothetical protein